MATNSKKPATKRVAKKTPKATGADATNETVAAAEKPVAKKRGRKPGVPKGGPTVLPSPNEAGISEAESEARLCVVFCDRLTQVLDRRPDVIRAGRGRVNDFATFFGIHYTTAQRLIHAKSTPNASMLLRLADAFDVSEGWLLGRGETDIDDHLDKAPIKIHVFEPRSERGAEYAAIPASQLPTGFDSSKLLFNRTLTEKGDEVCVVVKMAAEAVEGKVHLIYDPLNSKTYLRRINVNPGTGDLLCFGLESGRSETLKIGSVAFGKTAEAKGVSIVGPVVAQLRFDFRGD